MDALTPQSIRQVRPDEPDVQALLQRHFNLMRAQSPAESCHVLPTDALSAPDIRVFALRQSDVAMAVGALRISGDWGELKSMHTASQARGQGLGRVMLSALIDHAKNAGLTDLYLETGSGPEHAAARGLYQGAGFADCAPFGDYIADPLSCFMTLKL